jgi:hypothetical protein
LLTNTQDNALETFQLKMKKDGKWKTVQTVYVLHRDYREAREMLSIYMKKPRNWQLRNSNGKVLSKHKCYEDVAKDKTYIICIHHIPVEPIAKDINKTTQKLSSGTRKHGRNEQRESMQEILVS